MGSHKRSARAKEKAAFEAGVATMHSSSKLNALFSREEQHHEQIANERDEARRFKACESKSRYPSRADAELAKADCARHGTTGLEIYRCPYCNGRHLTSHPWKD